ncbi:hypothetical protein AVEN_194310-1, partial [Araneus ventricosus]
DIDAGSSDEYYLSKITGPNVLWNPKYEVRKESPHSLEEHRNFSGPLDDLPKEYSLMVDPRTGSPVKSAESPKKHLPQEMPKPYHPYQDHSYSKIEWEDKSDGESSALAIINDIFNSKDEPVVEPWDIDIPATHPVPEQPSSYRQTFEKETRRTSTRIADIRQRKQARISNAARAVLKSEKAQRIRQNKNKKPKNSVETTPSQSSQPARPRCTKVTKKNTSQGRIDHKESERRRREELNRYFSSLSDLVPPEYLRGAKVSSRITQQKILNGAEDYIGVLSSGTSSYKSCYHHNKFLRKRLRKKCSPKLVKCVKKQK